MEAGRNLATEASPGRSQRAVPTPVLENLLFTGLLGAVILRLWLLPLRTGFWLDETGTFWAAKGTLSQVFSHSLLWPSQFPAYSALMWIMLRLPGPPEVLMRLPSLAATAAAAWFVYRIGVRLISKRAAWIAVLVFASFEPVAFAAVDARSYAIGLMAVTGSMLMLIRWMDTGTLRDALGYAVLAALTWQMQYVFATAFVVQATYLLVASRRRGRSHIPQVLTAIVTAVLLGSLTVPHLTAMLRTATSHGFAGSPTLADLLATLAPPVIVGSAVLTIGIALLSARYVRVSIPSLARQDLFLLVAWLLVPCLIPFAISFVSSAKIFLPRYVLPYSPAVALLAGLLLSGIEPARLRMTAVIVVIAASVLASHGVADTSHGGDWKKAVQTVNSMAAGAPVLFRSGFPESEPFNWLGNRERTEYLLAPLSAYPAPLRIVPLPFRFDSAARTRLEQIASSDLQLRDRFLLIEMGDSTYDLWLAGRLAPAGFHSQTISGFGGPHDSLRIVVFAKQGS